ncbi:hypothetical protein RDI58_011166 [Solanum bulbocastanum]|uniref:Uncharacterized protein n=1 Tax=Solanum bulbocastanum TaxID=147425 RepID=A0AAN8YGP3_SOLBU
MEGKKTAGRQKIPVEKIEKKPLDMPHFQNVD